MKQTLLQINQVGVKNLRFSGAEDQEKELRNAWIQGIISSMTKSGRFNPKEGIIRVSDKRLFKTELNFSAELVEGQYLVDTLLLKNGSVIAARRSFINVLKSGYGEMIYKMAKEQSLIYGLMSVMFALGFGFVVHESVRRLNA